MAGDECQRCRQGQKMEASVIYSNCDGNTLESFEQRETWFDHVEIDLFSDWRIHC